MTEESTVNYEKWMKSPAIRLIYLLGASEVSANLYCNSRTSVLGRLRDYLRLLMGRTLACSVVAGPIAANSFIQLLF